MFGKDKNQRLFELCSKGPTVVIAYRPGKVGESGEILFPESWHCFLKIFGHTLESSVAPSLEEALSRLNQYCMDRNFSDILGD